MDQNTEQEVWKDVLDWPYKASNLGRVVRTVKVTGTRAGKPIKGGKSKLGYSIICLSDAPRKKCVTRHGLIMLVFCGPTPEGMEIDHIDGNRLNNRLDNLRFVTPSENINGAVARGHRGHKRWNAKLTDEIVREIRLAKTVGIKASAIADQLGVSQSTVFHVLRGDNWKHVL